MRILDDTVQYGPYLAITASDPTSDWLLLLLLLLLTWFCVWHRENALRGVDGAKGSQGAGLWKRRTTTQNLHCDEHMTRMLSLQKVGIDEAPWGRQSFHLIQWFLKMRRRETVLHKLVVKNEPNNIERWTSRVNCLQIQKDGFSSFFLNRNKQWFTRNPSGFTHGQFHMTEQRLTEVELLQSLFTITPRQGRRDEALRTTPLCRNYWGRIMQRPNRTEDFSLFKNIWIF